MSPKSRSAASEPRKAPRRQRAAGSSGPRSGLRSRAQVMRSELMMSGEEKRELILAHAAMRRTRDPVQLASLWIGVAATFLVVIGCWAWAFAPGALKAFKEPMPEVQEFMQGLSSTTKAMQEAQPMNHSLTQQLHDAAERLEKLQQQVSSTDAALDRVAGQLNASSTTSTARVPRPDVFQASSSTSSIH